MGGTSAPVKEKPSAFKNEERDRNVVLSPGVTSARQKISDFFLDEKKATYIIMNLHYAVSYY